MDERVSEQASAGVGATGLLYQRDHLTTRLHAQRGRADRAGFWKTGGRLGRPAKWAVFARVLERAVDMTTTLVLTPKLGQG